MFACIIDADVDSTSTSFPSIELSTSWFNHSSFGLIEVRRFCDGSFVNHYTPVLLVHLFLVGSFNCGDIQIDSTFSLNCIRRCHAICLGNVFLFGPAYASQGFKVPRDNCQFKNLADFLVASSFGCPRCPCAC
jgi:hypothetical protein